MVTINDKWEERLVNLENRYDGVEETLTENTAEIARLRKENDFLLGKLKHLNKTNKEQGKELKQLRKTVRQLEKGKATSEGELKKLRAENRYLKDLVARFERGEPFVEAPKVGVNC